MIWFPLALTAALRATVNAPWKEIMDHQSITELYAVWAERPGEIVSYLKSWSCEQTPFIKAAKKAGLYDALLNLLPPTPAKPSGCKSFVQVGKHTYCDPKNASSSEIVLKPLPGEILLGVNPTAILYVEPGCSQAHELVGLLDSFIIRPIVKHTAKQAHLTGYGVDYEIRDSRVTHPKIKLEGFVKQPALSTNSTINDPGKPIALISDVGLKIASLLQDSDDPFTLLKTITMNFPLLAQSISAVESFEPASTELKALKKLIPAGFDQVSINGLTARPDALNLFR